MDANEHDACAANELAEGCLKTVNLGGTQVLLTRIAQQVFAVGAICPHAGADLAEGVLYDGVVTCPWHKASFDVRSGRCTAAPALDDLPSFAAREEAGRILLRLPGMVSLDAEATPGDTRCMAIVGAGAAGAAAAQTFRRAGFTGRVVLIGREGVLPYDRTVLSKYTLAGAKGDEKSPLQSAYYYNRHEIERISAEVTSIDATGRVLIFADGSSIGYSAALIATGGAPRRPDIPGIDLPGVHVLRSAADAEAIVRSAQGARRCIVLGAGFIGMEAAASLHERGLDVHVVASESAPLEAQLGPDVGWAVAALHQDRGVTFHMGRHVARLAGEHRVKQAELEDGTTIAADMVIIGQGIAPETALLGHGAQRKDGGVKVDAGMKLAENLFAAGDIAAFPLYGAGGIIRVEHWRVAEQQGRVAALNMLGGQERFVAAPYFWTTHFTKRLDYVGHAEDWDEVVIDGDAGARQFLAFYLRGGLVAALAGMERDRQVAAAIRLLEQRQDWTVDGLRHALAAYA